jgi:hypothetical protein
MDPYKVPPHSISKQRVQHVKTKSAACQNKECSMSKQRVQHVKTKSALKFQASVMSVKITKKNLLKSWDRHD